jgi:CRP/FNR family transcriptional regulator, cyclic AMP receptor protein
MGRYDPEQAKRGPCPDAMVTPMPMTGRDKQEALGRVDFFSGCGERVLHDIASLSEDRVLPVGTELCRQGEYESEVFLIVSGEAEVYVDGARVGTEGPGHIVGELSMLDSGRRNATLRAVSPLVVLAIDPREIDSVLAADPSSARRLSEHGGHASLDG